VSYSKVRTLTRFATADSEAVMATTARREESGRRPTLAQQYADAVGAVADAGLDRRSGGPTGVFEVVLHVRGDGCTLDDGSPIPGSVVERVAPTGFLQALIHDAEGRPINAFLRESSRRRHPTARQKRVVKERYQHCVDCGASSIL